MERSIQKSAWINLLVLLGAGAAVFAAGRFAGSPAGEIASVFFGLGALIAAASWFHIRLIEREGLEKLEIDELARSRGQGSLFEGRDSEVFPARRSREQFEKWFIPFFTLLLLVAEGAATWLLWKWLSGHSGAAPGNVFVALSIWALCGLILFILGRFAVAFARTEANRLLRASASYVLLGAYLCFILAADMGLLEAGVKWADGALAMILVGLIGLVALETLVALILEIYRPRVRGKVIRPVYESRLVSLLGQPEGLVRTAAQTLDYQFGFKVSETWFYRFLQGALGWIILLQAAALLLSTMVVFINPGEQAILLRFGKPVAGRELLNPGAHLTLPWPVDKVLRQQTEQVQSFSIGRIPDKESELQKAVLWTVAHGTEDNFLVPSLEEERATTTAATGAETRRTPPVNLLSISIPVQFQITNLIAWSFTDDDPAKLLQDLATHETTKYLASVDFLNVMGRGREAAALALLDRIQAAAVRRQIGVRILFVGLEGVHPPVKVAGDFAKLIAETQNKEAALLNAQAIAVRTNALAGARVEEILNLALAERARREAGAIAQTGLFTNQLAALRAAPLVYPQRLYLDTFSRAVAGSRKYIMLATNTTDIIQFDLQDKIRTDILEGLTAPSAEKK